MRPRLVVLAAIVAALAAAVLYESATGDASARVFVVQALTFAALVAVFLSLRSGVPLGARVRGWKRGARTEAAR